MRAALWLMALFAIAVATALFAGNNPGTVTLFWSPHRIDLSLNFFLLLLAGVFLMLHLAMRAMSALMRIPQQARRWRLLQKERAMHTALLDSLSHLVSGRFIRARKAAELVVSLEESLLGSGEKLAYSARLRTLAHLVAAEGAHALQDRVVRDAHFAQALKMQPYPTRMRHVKVFSCAVPAGHWRTGMRTLRHSGWTSCRSGRRGARLPCACDSGPRGRPGSLWWPWSQRVC